MADLPLWRWKKFLPAMGDNLSLEKPFYFRVKSGVSKLAYQDWRKRVAEAIAVEWRGGADAGTVQAAL
jgi:hypothetical protein